MAQEFGGDLAGAVFWGADLRGATFRDVHLGGVRISHALMVDVEVDALVDRLVVNGVDVTDVVNAGDRWYPLRTVLAASDPAAMVNGWSMLESSWTGLVERVADRPELAAESVAGEWTLVQTLRHLGFAMDKWFTVPVLGGSYHPVGLPNSGSVDHPWPGLDPASDPTFDEVLTIRAERSARFASEIAAITADDLDRAVVVDENGDCTLRDCISTVLEEEFWHLRYAERDLAVLTGR